MRKLQLLFLLSSLLFATGCPKYRPKVDFNRNGFVKQVNTFLYAKQQEYVSVLGTDPARAKQIRNEVIETALPYLDEAYMDFITDIQAGRDRDNFVADLIELGATASVGIVNGERPLQIIGVALTAFRGGRRSADLNFYKEQATPVLITKMDGNRARVRATILNREREEVTTYPLPAAIGDIVDYYNAGTLVRAFTELQKDASLLTRQAENEVLVLKGVPLTGEATQTQRDLQVGSAKILQALRTDFAGADQAKKDVDTKILQSIVATLQKDATVASVLSNAGVSAQDNGQKILESLIEIRRSAMLVNNNSLVDKIDQVIVARGLTPPAPTPTPSPSATPRPSPSPSPTASPSNDDLL